MDIIDKRYMVDDAGSLIDMVTRDSYDYVSELVDHLNHKQWIIDDLSIRNSRQAIALDELYNLIDDENWKKLTIMRNEAKEFEKLLRTEADAKCIRLVHGENNERDRITI